MIDMRKRCFRVTGFFIIRIFCFFDFLILLFLDFIILFNIALQNILKVRRNLQEGGKPRFSPSGLSLNPDKVFCFFVFLIFCFFGLIDVEFFFYIAIVDIDFYIEFFFF